MNKAFNADTSGELTDNPLPRCACMLVADVSGGMVGSPITQLSASVRKLVTDIQQDELASQSIELGLITFGDKVRALLPLTPAHRITGELSFQAGGAAPMGEAVTQALKALELRENAYRKAGVSFSPSRLILISRGNPSDAWQTVADIARALTAEHKVLVLPLGIGRKANLAALGRFSGEPVKSAESLHLSELILGHPVSMVSIYPSRPVLDAVLSRTPKFPSPVLSSGKKPDIAARQIREASVQQAALRPVSKSQSLDAPAQLKGAEHGPAMPKKIMPRQERRLQLAFSHWCKSHGKALSCRLRALVNPRQDLLPAPVVVAPVPLRLTAARNWVGAAETCVGAAHLRQEPPVPCQDAALVVMGNFPLLVVADGAGSSPVSDIGAQAVVAGLRRLVDTISRQYRGVLDSPEAPDAATTRALAHTLVRHACGLLEDLAASHRRVATDFRCTLLAAVGGREHWLWVRVGDGALVVERDGQLQMLGHAGKGEFANQTVFLGAELRPDQVQWGSEAVTALSGVAAMTDGAAERLVSMDGQRVSGQLGTFFQDARDGKLRRTNLHAFLEDRDTWKGSSGDDRGLAILACNPE